MQGRVRREPDPRRRGPLGDAELVTKYGGTAGVIAAPGPSAFNLASPKSGLDKFNYVIGTQTFAPAYQFTNKPRIIETVEAIHAMGATVVKFELSPRYARGNGNVPRPMPTIHSLVELARDEPSHRQVLDMPLPHFCCGPTRFAAAKASGVRDSPRRRRTPNTANCTT